MAKKVRADSASPRAGKSAPVTVEIRLDGEILKQIKLHALATDRSVSAVIAENWSSTPRRFWLHSRPGQGELPTATENTTADCPRLAVADAS